MSLSSVDLTALEVQLLQALGAAVLALAILALKRFGSWIGIRNTAEVQSQLEAAADAALDLGVARATDLIKAKGWDHIDVKNATIATAGQYAVDKFPGVLKQAGIDISNPTMAAASLAGILERRFPAAISKASASPATPPVPDKPTLASSAAVVSQ